MSEPDPVDPAVAPAAPSGARRALLKRLADVVSLPSSRVNAFERAVTADLLVEILREASPEDRLRTAQRLAVLTEIPNSILRLLLRDEIKIAGVLIEECASLTDADLAACAREASVEHRLAIAHRRQVSEIMSEALVCHDEAPVLIALLHNMGARLSQSAIESMVAASRRETALLPYLLRRPELRPSSAYIMFWWCDAEARRTVLQRFAVSREVLQEATEDVFRIASEEGWNDPLSRKALQFIERRQRNRGAIEKSPYADLEAAVAAAEGGLSSELADEIAFLSGLKPATGAKIFADRGGEPIAVMCKATGLPKSALVALWKAARAQETEPAELPEAALIAYDMIAVDRAQTVLRYWNWALSSALTPALVRAIRDGDEDWLDEYSVPQRAAMLAMAEDFRR